MVESTSASLQGNNLTLGQQIIQVFSLVRDLQSAIGGSRTTNVEIKGDAGIIKRGLFSVKCSKALDKVQSRRLLALLLTRKLNNESVDAVVSISSRVYNQAMHAVASIAAEMEIQN
ncbi:unnamed protein product [Albugo candida]|uniref:Uncharacterized protein n=1 Tax=Albugo candida TaxID=65357 RepID=A0A024FTE1_9STRA|nr:unnamed protein product [Albugo candida]|eukprot:CCI10370.1 unnamed protein product [Albugo candida]